MATSMRRQPLKAWLSTIRILTPERFDMPKEPETPLAKPPAANSKLTTTPATSRLSSYPPHEKWDDWVEYDSRSWPKKVERRYSPEPTTCFNCEAACGLLAYVD